MTNTGLRAWPMHSAEEITAACLTEGDVVSFTRDGVHLRAMEIERSAAWTRLRWAGQGERCQLPNTRVLFRIARRVIS